MGVGPLFLEMVVTKGPNYRPLTYSAILAI